MKKNVRTYASARLNFSPEGGRFKEKILSMSFETIDRIEDKDLPQKAWNAFAQKIAELNITESDSASYFFTFSHGHEPHEG